MAKNMIARKIMINTGGDRVFMTANYILLISIFFIIAYPLYFILIGSFDPKIQSMEGFVLFPSRFSLQGYKAILGFDAIWIGYKNSILYTVVGTSINLFLTTSAAYALSRKDLVGRRFIILLFIFTMYFSGGLIPDYLLIINLGLINSIWALVLPSAISVYNMIVMRTYFNTQIPVELLEASQIDGCRNLQFLVRIVLPLSKPIIAVVGLFYAVNHWNSYFSALIYLKDAQKRPLQLVLREILVLNKVDSNALVSMDVELLSTLADRGDLMKYSMIIVASIPIILLYPFIQRYFVSGVMIGSVKG